MLYGGIHKTIEFQGEVAATRWQWNATVGPLVDRPGRVGDWGYVNTEYVRSRLAWNKGSLPSVVLEFWSTFSSSRMQAWSLSWLFGQVSTSCAIEPSIKAKRSALAGYSLGGTSLAENQLAPFIQQAIDQVRRSGS